MRLALIIFWGAWLARPASGAQELVHDPSQAMQFGRHLVVWSSGTDGNRLQTQYRLLDRVRWERGEAIDIDIDWVDDEFGAGEHEFDAPGVFKNRIYFTKFDEGPEYPGGIQDGIGLILRTGFYPGFSYADGGPVVRSLGEGDHPRAMDPAAFETPAGNEWLVFGSYAGGIYAVELDPVTGRMKQFPEDVWAHNPDLPRSEIHPERFRKIAARPGSNEDDDYLWNHSEAPYIWYEPSTRFYYLFVNWGRCCDGVRSTYEIRVGRSRSPTGPYIDRGGVDMRAGGGSLFLDTTGNTLGHASLLRQSDGRVLLTFHYYDAADAGISKLGQALIAFSSGWPAVVATVSRWRPDSAETDTVLSVADKGLGYRSWQIGRFAR